jgi:tetrahydromethanopterin S-methyltransferase subunit G
MKNKSTKPIDVLEEEYEKLHKRLDKMEEDVDKIHEDCDETDRIFKEAMNTEE